MMLCSGLLEDVDLERKVVRWRGEHDKTGFEHETILTDAAVEALWEARRRCSPATDRPSRRRSAVLLWPSILGFVGRGHDWMYLH